MTSARLQIHASAPDTLVGEEVRSRGPGLILDTHRLAALAVVPFVESSQPVQFREFLQRD
jgi:hypothetical protein